MRQISDLTRRGDSVAERRPRLVGGARSTEAHALSHIDEHSAIVDADPGRVWCALGDVLGRERLPGRGIVARLLDAQPATRSGDPLLAGSTLPGFTVVRSEPHSEVALEGRHRASEQRAFQRPRRPTRRAVVDASGWAASGSTRLVLPKRSTPSSNSSPMATEERSSLRTSITSLPPRTIRCSGKRIQPPISALRMGSR